jgi:hypothetical protein
VSWKNDIKHESFYVNSISGICLIIPLGRGRERKARMQAKQAMNDKRIESGVVNERGVSDSLLFSLFFIAQYSPGNCVLVSMS